MRLRRRRARFALAAQLDEQEFTRWLVERGGHATTAVELPGEFSLRGGILDIFAPDADDPVRIELFGDEVESIRRFDVASQRSLETLQSMTITMLEPTASDRAHFTSYRAAEHLVPAHRAERARGRGQVLSGTDGPAAGVFTRCGRRWRKSTSFRRSRRRACRRGRWKRRPILEFESVERFSGEIAQGARRAGQGQRWPRSVRRLRDGCGDASGCGAIVC